MSKNKKKYSTKVFLLASFVAFSFFAANGVHAQLVPCGIGSGNSDCTLCHLVVGFKNIYDYLLTLLLVATTTVIVIAGVMYMVSSGDKGMIEKAKAAFTYALTAIVLALTAWLIINATLNALGFKNAGSWWTFTCDTTQTAPIASSGGATLPGGGTTTGTGKGGGISGKGRDISVPQDGSKLAQALEKYKGTIYVWGKNYINSDGVLVADCSGFTQRIYQEVYGIDIPHHAKDQATQAFDYSKMVNGTLLISSGHVGIYYDGSVYHSAGKGKDVRVANADYYIKSLGVTGMRLPPTQSI
jgi:cell wall-associated NlpC family hydrolase